MAPPAETKKADGPPSLEEGQDMLDLSAFEQILEMDDDDDRDFSKGIVFGFFDQAVTTFEKMEKKISEKDLPELSSLGHFLKGSSATLGMTLVKDGCEKIQHYGAGKDETGTTDEPDKEVSLKKISDTLVDVKKAYFKVERFLRRYYGEKVEDEPEEKKAEEKEKPAEKKEAAKEDRPEKKEEKESPKEKKEEPKK